MKKIFAIALACGFAGTLGAQTFSSTQAVTNQELRASEQEYAQLAEAIRQEKEPLSKELNSLESEVIRLRAEVAHVRGQAEGGDTALINLQAQVSGLNNNKNYISNLLSDYSQRFEILLHSSELPLYEEDLRAAKLALENDQLSAGQKFAAQLATLNVALKRTERIIGGQLIQGEAKTPNNEVQIGNFALFGPVAYFANDVAAGLAMKSSSLIPEVIAVPKASEAIRQLALNGKGSVPVDTTGQASQFQIQEQTVVEEVITGGFVMIPIIGLTLAAALIAIWKWLELAKVRPARQRDVDTILEHLVNGRKEDALAYARGVRGPVGELLETAVQYSDEDREIVEEVLYEKIITTQPKLERMLPFIAVTAATAPLLGLLGTVTGMMKTFNTITVVGTGDARSLSGGISEALITTKWGLISAIPALIVHAMLSRKARGVVGSMEQTAVSFINGIVEIREGSSSQAV